MSVGQPPNPSTAGGSEATSVSASPRNIDTAQRLWEKFLAGLERGEPGAWFEDEPVAADFEWVLPTPLDGRRVWGGRAGFVEFIRTWTEQFTGWMIRVERWVDGGDRVVALTRQSARGAHSEVPVDLALGQVHEYQAGELVRIRVYLSHGEALEAAGLGAKADT